MHILIGLPEEIIMEEPTLDEDGDICIDEETGEELWEDKSYPITCYETCVGQCVMKHGKTLTYYNDNSIEVDITPTQYENLKNFLEYHVEQKTPFNFISYVWNFLPITRLCPLDGGGFFCAQLVAKALHFAKIIDLDRTYVKTKGYLSTFFCCPSQRPKRVRIPKSYQLTVEMTFDIIKEDNDEFRFFNPDRNPNDIARFSLDQKKKKKRRHRHRQDVKGTEFIYHPVDIDDETQFKDINKFRYDDDDDV